MNPLKILIISLFVLQTIEAANFPIRDEHDTNKRNEFTDPKIKALEDAIQQRDTTLIRHLVNEEGLDINQYCKDLTTRLIDAIENGDADMVERLLELGADPNNGKQHQAKAFGDSVVTIYISNNGTISNHITNCLIDFYLSPVPPTAVFSESNALTAPITIACFRPNSEDIIKSLLSHGADPNTSEAYVASDRTALLWFFFGKIGHSHSDDSATLSNLFKDLPLNPDIHLKISDSFPLELIVTQPGSYDDKIALIDLLLSKGADINMESSITRKTALSQALLNGEMRLARALIDKGADINIVYRSGMVNSDTPEMSILDLLRYDVKSYGTEEMSYKTEIIEYLREKGLDYKSYPIPERVREYAKEHYPSNTDLFLKNY